MNTTVPDYPRIIFQKTKIVPTNVFEIGASDGTDAEYLRQVFGLSDQSVFCFEPDPRNFSRLIANHPRFNSFQVAVSNVAGKAVFHCHGPAADISSLRKRIYGYPYQGSPDKNYKEISVTVIRMDEFIKNCHINQIDVCKIDVEGFSYDVLNGFGESLNIVKAMHVEAEKIPLFDNPRLFGDVRDFLISKGYTMVDYTDFKEICDSIWVRNDLVK